MLEKLYLWHKLDLETGEYLGFIGDEKSKYHTDRYWKIVGSFYAIEPDMRPIPTGMKLFCAKRNESFPYNTLSLENVYDPFNRKTGCTYFITYNQPVPNTVPLYLHNTEGNVFPSFDRSPPSSNSNWDLEGLNPIFVIPVTIGERGETGESIRFRCDNGRCIPVLPGEDGETLDECFLRCSDFIKPRRLLDYLGDKVRGEIGEIKGEVIMRGSGGVDKEMSREEVERWEKAVLIILAVLIVILALSRFW